MPRKVYSKERTEYMQELNEELRENGLSKNSADQYIQTLRRLNGGEPYNDLQFLINQDIINQKIAQYNSSASQRTIVATIVSVLSSVANLHLNYRKAFDNYKDLLDKMIDEKNKEPKNVMTERQEKNWISMDQIREIRDKKIKEVEAFDTDEDLNRAQWSTLSQALLLSLFTFIPPRRNADYIHMYVSRKPMVQVKQKLEYNYYFVKDGILSFNNYKTSKTYGNQTFDINNNEPLLDILDEYIKYHPNNRFVLFPLLVSYYGEPYSDASMVSQIINRAFKELPDAKQIGSTMIRHIYLTNEFEDEDEKRKKIADSMGHSISMQRDYILKPKAKVAKET